MLQFRLSILCVYINNSKRMNFFVGIALSLSFCFCFSLFDLHLFCMCVCVAVDALLFLTSLFFFYRFYKCSLRLADILVRPTQRLTKYGLLLGAIRKHVVDENDAESLDLMVCVVGHFLPMHTYTHTHSHPHTNLNSLIRACMCMYVRRVVNEYCFYAQETNHVTNENPLAFY